MFSNQVRERSIGLSGLCVNAVLAAFCVGSLGASPAESLRVSENGRYLETARGEPFLYLGDTAWELFHRLKREEADMYLQNRAQKGFTVIQAVILGQLGGLDEPNPYGQLPLIDRDPTRPNEAYFEHVDWIVKRAAELGLYVGMLPTWGSYWKQVGDNTEPIFNEENARAYGEFLGRRYRDAPLIWILGGDENIESPGERRVIDAMAEGLREGDGGAHLITYHPRGPGRSTDFLLDAPWLDFHMIQSSHGAHDHDNGLFVEAHRRSAPGKPTLDGEPRYETLAVGFYWVDADRLDRFDDYDVRQAAYWAMLAGACGHTYGHGSLWQMWAPERPPVLFVKIPWYEALDHPGAWQMSALRGLFEARPFWKLVPRQEMILDGPNRGGGKIRAAVAEDGSFAVVYSPRGEPFTIDKGVVQGRVLCERWYDPRYGVTYLAHCGNTPSIQTYTPPTSGRGQDWILILDAADNGLPEPRPWRSR